MEGFFFHGPADQNAVRKKTVISSLSGYPVDGRAPKIHHRWKLRVKCTVCIIINYYLRISVVVICGAKNFDSLQVRMAFIQTVLQILGVSDHAAMEKI